MSQSGFERRQWTRVPAAALGHITASVVAGPDVRLVNLSRGGALMEVASRFPMRSRVRLKLTQATGEVTVAEGVVAWARVAAIVDKQVNYLVAVIFDKVIPDLGGLDAAPAGELPAALYVEAAPTLVAARDNLTQFPVPALPVPESPSGPDARSEADEHVVSLEGQDGAQAAAGGQPSEALVALTVANDSLAAQLAAAEVEHATLRGHLETERRARQDERDRLQHEAATAAANAAALQAVLTAREQEHAVTLAEQRSRLEAGESGLSEREQEHAHALAEQLDRYASLQAALAAREQEHARAVAELAEQQARNEALQLSLLTREQEHARALADVAERHARYEALQLSLVAREQEHERAVAELAAQEARYGALQESLATREQAHVQALAGQKAGYEALAAELLQASHDQQAEYQVLLDQQTAAREEERRRAEAQALELAQRQEDATQERERLELRQLDLQARLEAAESLSAAHLARNRNLRSELEKLMTMISTLLNSAALPTDGHAREVEHQEGGREAVA